MTFKRFGMYHAVAAWELKAALDQLRADDVLVPNDVSNLAVFRDGEQIGYIDFGKLCHVETWNPFTEQP